MGWSEWRLGMGHQLILTANCEKYRTAYFVVEDLMLHQGQIFCTALMCFIYLFLKKDCFLLLFACDGNNVLVCVHSLYVCRTVEAHLWGCFSIAAFNSYLSWSGNSYLTSQITEAKPKCLQIQAKLWLFLSAPHHMQTLGFQWPPIVITLVIDHE